MHWQLNNGVILSCQPLFPVLAIGIMLHVYKFKSKDLAVLKMEIDLPPLGVLIAFESVVVLQLWAKPLQPHLVLTASRVLQIHLCIPFLGLGVCLQTQSMSIRPVASILFPTASSRYPPAVRTGIVLPLLTTAASPQTHFVSTSFFKILEIQRNMH